jgi:hypothetical protein
VLNELDSLGKMVHELFLTPGGIFQANGNFMLSLSSVWITADEFKILAKLLNKEGKKKTHMLQI